MRRSNWNLNRGGLRHFVWAILGLALIYFTSQSQSLQLRNDVSSGAADPYSFAESTSSTSEGDSEKTAASASGQESTASKDEVKEAPSSEKEKSDSSENQEEKAKSSSNDSAADKERSPSTETKGEEEKKAASTNAKTSEGDRESDEASKKAEEDKDQGASPKKRMVARGSIIRSPTLQQHELFSEDVFADILGEEHPHPIPSTTSAELREAIDPVIAKLDELIFHGSNHPEGSAPDLMDASLDWGRLVRGFDLGEKAAKEETGDIKLFDSLGENEAPEALRGLVTLDEQGVIGGYLVRLWQMHKRLGLGLRDAMTSFLASVEKERTRSAAIAAVMGVHKLREKVKEAKKNQDKAVEANAELTMLRKQHKYMGKQRKRLRKKLLKQEDDPNILAMELEEMWAPVDAVAAFDPARGSSFYYSMKVVEQDARSVTRTCMKLMILMTHATEESSLATGAQLAKEAKEEDELRAVLNPDTGPLAALSSSSLSALSTFNPKALQKADNEFMKRDTHEGSQQKPLPSPQQHPSPASAPVATVIGKAPRLLRKSFLGDPFQDEEKEEPRDYAMPLGSTELVLSAPLEHDSFKGFSHRPQSVPSVIYDETIGPDLEHMGIGSFLELEAQATPMLEEPLEPHNHLSPIAPHEMSTSGLSLLSLKETSEKEEEEEEGQQEAGSASESTSAKQTSEAAAPTKASGEEGDEQEKESGGETKQPEKEPEGEPKEQGKESEEEGSAQAKESVQESKEPGKESEAEASKQAKAFEGGVSQTEKLPEEEGSAKETKTLSLPTEDKNKEEDHPEDAPRITMLSELGKDSCESITDPATCMQTKNCFQDFIYGACFFNCTTAVTPEECGTQKFCRFETRVPHHACVNEGYQTTSAVVQRFEGIMRGCEHFTKKETCDWMYQHGLKQEKQKENKKGEEGHISPTAHLGASPYHCQWMPGPSDSKSEKEVKEVGGFSICGNIRDAPTAERLLWGTVVAEKEKKLRELKAKEDIQQGDICVRPSDRLAVLHPNRPFYSVGSIVKFSCLPGSVLLGVSDEIECKADGNFEPALACVEESDLSEAQLGHLRRKAAIMSAAGDPTLDHAKAPTLIINEEQTQVSQSCLDRPP